MRYIVVFFFLGITLSLNGQIAADALRYSILDFGGTARTVGAGSAMGALGADYGVISNNPAGLAVYRTSEFVITPTIHISKVNSTLEGEGNEVFDETKRKFNLNNFGLVLNNRPRSNNWSNINFAIGMNRQTNFNQTIFYDGLSEGSFTDRFVELSTGFAPADLDGFEAGVAYEAGAIFEFPPNSANYANDFAPFPGVAVPKRQTIKTTGGISEMIFSLGGNFQEKLMLGATVGVPFYNFNETKVYEESDDNDEIFFFNDMTFTESLSTDGIGINLKLGAIYNISKMFRIGAAFHTPTNISLTDNFTTSLEYSFTDNGIENRSTADSPEGTFDYRLRTPWRAIVSGGALFKGLGFITAEVEYIDYSTSSFNLTANTNNIDDEVYQREINSEIAENFTAAVNIRLGAEFLYEKLRFRAGYAINGTPYANDNISNNSYSLGIGVRDERYYIDVAYKRNVISEAYIPYRMSDPANQQVVDNDIANGRYMLTFGYKF